MKMKLNQIEQFLLRLEENEKFVLRIALMIEFFN